VAEIKDRLEEFGREELLKISKSGATSARPHARTHTRTRTHRGGARDLGPGEKKPYRAPPLSHKTHFNII